MLKLLEVECERRWLQTYPTGDDACSQPIWPTRDEQSIDRQPMLVGDGTERGDGVRQLHD